MAVKKPRRSKTKRTSMRDKVKNRAQERESTGGGGWLNIESDVEFFNPKKGRNIFDILPYEVTVDNHPEVAAGELWYQRTVWVHYGIGAEEKSYVCPLKTIGKKCPICEHRAALMKDPDADDDMIKELKPRERELFNVRHDDEIKLFTFSYHLFGKQLEEEVREGNDEYAGFADLDGGCTLKVRFSEKKLGRNKFLEASRIDFTQKDDESESVLEEVQNLDEVLKILPYDDLEGVYWETQEEKEEDKPESKRPPKKSSSKSKPKSKAKEPDCDACPHDLEMGADFDQYDVCDECECREACEDAGAEPEPEPEPRPEAKPEAKPKPKPKAEPEEESCDACPSDMEFGTDFDQYDVCDKCDCRDDCETAAGGGAEEPEDEPEPAADGECPHGFPFGEDCNDHDECDDCHAWEACQDLKDEMEATGAKKTPAKKAPAKKKPKRK